MDMPVDPNEPTYCICGQVSFGEMICCDNQDVRTDRVAGAGKAVLTVRARPASSAPRSGSTFPASG